MKRTFTTCYDCSSLKKMAVLRNLDRIKDPKAGEPQTAGMILEDSSEIHVAAMLIYCHEYIKVFTIFTVSAFYCHT